MDREAIAPKTSQRRLSGMFRDFCRRPVQMGHCQEINLVDLA